MRNILESPALGIGPFQKVQREVIYSPYVVRKNRAVLEYNASFIRQNDAHVEAYIEETM